MNCIEQYYKINNENKMEASETKKLSNLKCSIPGCPNTRRKNPEKYLFHSPKTARAVKVRDLWIKATEKNYGPNSTFVICEDHFDLRNDVYYYKMNGAPLLKRSAHPHRNLTISDMELQAKLDKINWRCFVPSCKNKRLDLDREVIFFPVPEGLLGQLWKSAVAGDERCFNSSSDRIEICCEEHFNISTDVIKKFRVDSSVVYTIKDGILPRFNLNDLKSINQNKDHHIRLVDAHPHHRLIVNNDVAYLYASKFPRLIEQLQMPDDVAFINVREIKTEPIELNDIKVEHSMDEMPNIKTELLDAGYEYEISEHVVKEEMFFDNNPLKSEPESEAEKESETESSSTDYEDKDDPDFSDDVSSSDLDMIDSDDVIDDDADDDAESFESDDHSNVDTKERFECSYCDQLVVNLEKHIERSHWNFSKNINDTICGLCFETFPRRINLKNHQIKEHGSNAYACDICGFMSRAQGTMELHIIKLHTTEKPYLCQHCGAGYKVSSYLKRHVNKAHTARVRSHACHLCDKKFFDVTTLNSHISSVHSKLRPYGCNFEGCTKVFKKKTHLRTHQQVHTRHNIFSCIICDKKFTFKCNLQTHMKNIHKT